MTPSIPSLEAVGALGNSAAVTLASPADPTLAQPITAFGQWFTREIDNVNTQMASAERSVQQLASGGVANLHDTMIQIEQARLAFQLAIQVRSRVMDAYAEVMRMQV